MCLCHCKTLSVLSKPWMSTLHHGDVAGSRVACVHLQGREVCTLRGIGARLWKLFTGHHGVIGSRSCATSTIQAVPGKSSAFASVAHRRAAWSNRSWPIARFLVLATCQHSEQDSRPSKCTTWPPCLHPTQPRSDLRLTHYTPSIPYTPPTTPHTTPTHPRSHPPRSAHPHKS